MLPYDQRNVIFGPMLDIEFLKLSLGFWCAETKNSKHLYRRPRFDMFYGLLVVLFCRNCPLNVS